MFLSSIYVWSEIDLCNCISWWIGFRGGPPSCDVKRVNELLVAVSAREYVKFRSAFCSSIWHLVVAHTCATSGWISRERISFTKYVTWRVLLLGKRSRHNSGRHRISEIFTRRAQNTNHRYNWHWIRWYHDCSVVSGWRTFDDTAIHGCSLLCWILTRPINKTACLSSSVISHLPLWISLLAISLACIFLLL